MLFRARGMERTSKPLHTCDCCSSPLVQPSDWHEAGALGPDTELRWWVARLCPECGWTDEDLYDQETLDRYDAALEQGTDILVAALQDLEHERMAAEIETFVHALGEDVVTADDFR